jgi:hypothetical protein
VVKNFGQEKNWWEKKLVGKTVGGKKFGGEKSVQSGIQDKSPNFGISLPSLPI